jgi:hypothetical protein
MTYDEFEKIFNHIIECPKDFILSEEPRNPEPVFNISKRTEEEKSRATYAIKFFPSKDVCLVWNYKRHREKHEEYGAGLSSLNIGKSWEDFQTDRDAFYPYYKRLGTKKCESNEYIYEKVYIVGALHLAEFLEDYQAYMELNSEDTEFPSGAMDDGAWRNENEKKKYSSLRYQRDKNFRKEVLDAYGHRCAVCRCGADEILQAAHTKEHKFANEGCLDPKYGICLCANHHLMYDNCLIDIDTKKLTLAITQKGKDKQIDRMPWYKEFNGTYAGKIIRRDDHV